MSRIRVDVSPDRMQAHVAVSAGIAASAEDLDAALAEAHVVAGIDEQLRAQIGRDLAREDFTLARRGIAKGAPAERGADGRFVPAFEEGIQPGRFREDGTLDFLDRDLVKAVELGALIGQLVPPTAGAAGFRVDGTEVLGAIGKPDRLRFGPHAICRADGRVIAAMAGAVAYVPDRSVDVVQHYEHKGDVDLRSGHLRMEGTLSVLGSVHHGFSVRASEDLEVKGMCDGGTLVAGGNLRVGGLVRGGTAGTVTAQGDVSAGAAESVTIHAGRDLTLRDAVHADLHAERITVTKHVRGGHARAERSIVVGDAGSVASAVTVLEVGLPRMSTEELLDVVARAKAQRRFSTSPGGERSKAGKSGRARAALASDTLGETLGRAQRREELLGCAFVEVRGTLYPGAVIRIGDRHYEVDWDAHAVRVSFDVEARTLRVESVTHA